MKLMLVFVFQAKKPAAKPQTPAQNGKSNTPAPKQVPVQNMQTFQHFLLLTFIVSELCTLHIPHAAEVTVCGVESDLISSSCVGGAEWSQAKSLYVFM